MTGRSACRPPDDVLADLFDQRHLRRQAPADDCVNGAHVGSDRGKQGSSGRLGQDESPLRKTRGLYAMRVCVWLLRVASWKGLSGRDVAVAQFSAWPRFYNPAMNKSRESRRPVRRAAWWVAFAALAGYLLADLT
jgi:hypothetical protein